MRIQIIVSTILVAVSYSSCHPPTHHVPDTPPQSIPNNHSVTGADCVAVVHRDTHSILRTRMKRSQIRKVSLSPEPAPPLYIRPDNSTKTNTTLPIQQPSPKISSSIPTLENIITPIFRAVILVLTLFHVNITWRIHAFHVGRRPLRHHDPPAGRGWPV